MTIELPPQVLKLTDAEWKEHNMTLEEFKQRWTERVKLDALSPQTGEKAPDIELRLLSPDGGLSAETFKLSDHLNRPVSLIFGSYTCKTLRDETERINQIFEAFKDRMDFCFIYIKEAHPADGRDSKVNREEGIYVNAPKNDDERAKVAATCMNRLNYKFPIALDYIHDETEDKYKAMPTRLYLIKDDGTIAWKSGLAPFYFDVGEWHKQIKKLV